MSNLPPNPYNSHPVVSQANANSAPIFNHNQQFSQVPMSQLPPGYGGLKDTNSNSPLHGAVSPQNSVVQNVNNYNQSASSSPAFNQPGVMNPSQNTLQSSPIRPQTSLPSNSKPMQFNPLSSSSPRPVTNANPSPTPFPPNYQPQRQINENAPPLVPSSQFNQPMVNGPPSFPSGSMPSQYPASSNVYAAPMVTPPVTSAYGSGSINPPFMPPPALRPRGPPVMTSQPNIPFSGPPSGLRDSPVIPGPPVSGPPSMIRPPMSSQPMGALPPVSGPPLSGPQSLPAQPAVSGPPMPGHLGPPLGQRMGINGPNLPPQPSSLMGPPAAAKPGLINAPSMPPVSVPPLQHYPGQQIPSNQSMNQPGPAVAQNQFGGHNVPPVMPPLGQNMSPAGLNIPQMGQNLPPMGQTVAPIGQQMGPQPSGSAPGAQKTNMQNRYPQMPQSNYNHQSAMQANQYPQQYNTQKMTQQMGQLSVTKQGFDQLWGHHMVDLLTCRQILPEYPEDPPEIRLAHQFADAPNCSPEIFRCTLNRIPETNSLLQKSRLPLGILIHPFKDLNHLPVIQCTTIVRCRSCRTYINPFVYFVDAKRWKCNLCYRVNDLPEEFQYDPVSKSYGDPSRRPEIKSATIEFIAPGEYMLRPPQPAVYLFLFDVSQIARDSGYLQVVCETLKNNLDQLPGDARTQIGFICYDAHVHYYLMSDGLALPKEMTVIDIDVNICYQVVCETLKNNLDQLPGDARTQIGFICYDAHVHYYLMSDGLALPKEMTVIDIDGGRITVFQTCLPNIGPGALQPREDPNARSSKDVAHLNPATDFYKRLALDCSGAQVAVDLFLLNSQYSDLATLSGMSKFSAGSVYHIPLFKAARAHQSEHLTRIFTRYLTRKIGFEAVMRVRCTRGIAIHTFHGNFFVRSTDLLSLPNVSPDAGFGMQLTIEESLSDLQQVCFQAALLYTSSKGERRIRVHTLALPLATNLTEVLHAADQQCIIGLVSKMAVDRCVSASLSEAREALSNVAVDALSAHRLAQNLPPGARAAALLAPHALRLLPLHLLALLKRRAFRAGTSTRLDDRVADMCALKCLPLQQLVRLVYPDLYPLHQLRDHVPRHAEQEEETPPDPPRLHLSAERVNSTGAYLLDDGECMIVYVGHAVSPAFLSDMFGVAAFSQLPDEARSIPRVDSEGNTLLHAFIDKLNDDRPYASEIIMLRDNSPSKTLFTDRLVDDRVESAFSYYEFLQHVKTQVK
ncbi:hypothetical protein O3G_MSEX013325 [Manduca sexta]|uniref:Protein transport protein Sec24A n=1 Tax=Manduca sexta TaxID=7130 RepID=A0A922CXV1_MANSE|nr:hypothetical protein O3G_MSEX013325 [Manduca sexta]